MIYELINWNGKVLEYYDNDQIEFEGKYLNGKKNGKGKEYNKYGVLIYEGEYFNGKRIEKNMIWMEI
jgi:antitoxin component YwqK of YwqJK toxin-antitoxin module